MTLYSRSGANIVSPVVASGQAPSGSGSITDRNGNRMNTDGIHFYDTLSASAAAVTVTGASPNPTTFTYTNPAGGSSSFTMNYSLYTIETNFGCSGITDYGRSQQQQGYLVSSITLPGSNGSYAITYESTVNPIHAGAKTGRIASITLPTGGSITYQYTGTNNGINCADGSTAGLTRTVSPGGVWTYTRSQVSGSHWKTTLKTPDNNDTVIHFQKVYETERIAYQGLESGGNILATVDTCYNGAASPCIDTTVAMPITRRTILTTPNGLSSAKRDEYYNSYGMPTVIDEYNYGPTLVRKTVTSYASLGNIHDGVSKVVVCTAGGTDSECNSSGTVGSKTTYAYDEAGHLQATTGTPQLFAVSGSRGNATTISNWVTGSTHLDSAYNYFDTGNIRQVTDPNSHTTTYAYNSTNCANSLMTTVTPAIASLATSMAWNCTGGVVTSTTDANGHATTVSYTDANFWRPRAVTPPATATTNLSYTISPSPSTTSTLTNSNGLTTEIDTYMDGLGRATQNRQANTSPSATKVDTTYDSLGRVVSVSNPYQSTGDSTYGLDTLAYDALGRTKSVTHSGDGNAAHTYYGGDVDDNGGRASQICTNGVGLPSLSIDEAGKKRQFWTDALGRLIEVDEPDPSTGSLTSGSVNNTCYVYDVLGDLKQVDQGAQHRYYNYDWLARVTSVQTPESGTTSYYYTTSGGALCAGDSGAVCRRTDARRTTTTYAYDTVNRLTRKSYSDGTTPAANFFYDQAPASWPAWSGVSFANAKGRMVLACTNSAAGTCTSPQTAVAYSYDQAGRVAAYWQCTPYNCGAASIWRLGYNYDTAGNVSSWTHPANFTVTNTYNAGCS